MRFAYENKKQINQDTTTKNQWESYWSQTKISIRPKENRMILFWLFRSHHHRHHRRHRQQWHKCITGAGQRVRLYYSVGVCVSEKFRAKKSIVRMRNKMYKISMTGGPRLMTSFHLGWLKSSHAVDNVYTHAHIHTPLDNKTHFAGTSCRKMYGTFHCIISANGASSVCVCVYAANSNPSSSLLRRPHRCHDHYYSR